MKQMLVLIKRDFRFCGRWLAVSALVILALELFFTCTKQGAQFSAEWELAAVSVFGPMPFLYKAMELETNAETQSFLRAIPVSMELQVHSKFLLAALICAAALSTGSIISVFAGAQAGFWCIASAAGIALLFHSIFLPLFYSHGSQYGQQCYAVFFLTVFLMEKFQLTVSFNGIAALMLFAAGAAVYGLSARRTGWERM